MNCPICDSVLIQGEGRRFETLCDHVSDPNEEYGPRPLRPTFICPDSVEDTKCPLGDNNLLFWDEMGSVYIKNYKLYQPVEKRLEAIANQKLLEPQNSFERKLSMESRYRSISHKFITLKNWKWEIRRNHTCNEKGEITKHKFFIQTFKKNNDISWTYYSGFWHMLIFCIKQFKRTIKTWKEFRSETDRKSLLEDFKPLGEWQLKDNYRKVFHWYVNTFYKKLKGELIK